MAEDARIITVKKIGEETAGQRAPGWSRPRSARRKRTRSQPRTTPPVLRRTPRRRRLAAQSEADRLKRRTPRNGGRSHEADRLKQANAAQMAAAQHEADRLKNENDATTAAAQAEADS